MTSRKSRSIRKNAKRSGRKSQTTKRKSLKLSRSRKLNGGFNFFKKQEKPLSEDEKQEQVFLNKRISKKEANKSKYIEEAKKYADEYLIPAKEKNATYYTYEMKMVGFEHSDHGGYQEYSSYVSKVNYKITGLQNLGKFFAPQENFLIFEFGSYEVGGHYDRPLIEIFSYEGPFSDLSWTVRKQTSSYEKWWRFGEESIEDEIKRKNKKVVEEIVENTSEGYGVIEVTSNLIAKRKEKYEEKVKPLLIKIENEYQFKRQNAFSQYDPKYKKYDESIKIQKAEVEQRIKIIEEQKMNLKNKYKEDLNKIEKEKVLAIENVKTNILKEIDAEQ